jgi:lipopolysaccharide export system protein LptA
LALCAASLPVREARGEEPDVSSAAPVSPKEAAGAPSGADSEPSVSMFPIQGDKPLSIKSDELEAIEVEGRRKLIFKRGVNVEQDDLKVQADHLEALYPPGVNQPDRLVASGHVRVTQRDKTMLCDAATYYQSEDRLVCTGNAELRQGSDRVQGREIEIFVKQNRVKVKGGATVNVAPSQPAATKSAAAATATPPKKAKP